VVVKVRLQSPVSLFKGMELERRRFVGLPRMLSKLPGGKLSLHEADFYRRHESND
jgi:hypothetical protein